MATLRTDYKDDKLNTSINTERQFEEVTNANGTKTFRDVTEYSQVGDDFGADLVNAQNEEINAKAPINSPAFTGVPTAPTPDTDTDDDTVATAAFVKANARGQVFWLQIDENGHLIYTRSEKLTDLTFAIVNHTNLEVTIA